ncbi:hypothetical protein U9M48_002503 [Paspalum notatum var. saurae]|uniref:AB hydrolase-1 domain-containing protein n=1 Tax=Paspalum notatum var. saurae TaxID=547442 RepID=A0AAQ3PJJ5_PASNO
MPAADPPATDAAPDETAPQRTPPQPRPRCFSSPLRSPSGSTSPPPSPSSRSSSPTSYLPPPPRLSRLSSAGTSPPAAYPEKKKLDPAPGLFAVTSRPAAAAAGGSPAHRVLILPGLAAGSFSFRRVFSSLSSRGVLAAALDLPGQGLSPAPPASAAPARASALREIMDRGVFHAFEHLVQTGEVPYQEEPEAAPPAGSPHAPDEAAAAVARAVEALGVGPVHLVLHDSALAAGAAFASANPGAVRSVTLVDAAASLPAFPAAVFDVPVLGRLVLRVPALFRGFLRLCCARGMGAEEAEAHRAAMRWGEGRAEGVVQAWKAMNHSFQLGEWRHSSEEVRRLPMMVLWSGTWSDRWIDEGKKVAAALPDAKFVYHSGSRWPQEDASEEISGLLAEFVTSTEEVAGGRIE